MSGAARLVPFPSSEHFELACSKLSITILEKAIENKQYISAGEQVWLVIRTVVGAPLEVAGRVCGIAGQALVFLVCLKRMHWKDAGYHLGNAVIFHPVTMVTGLVSRIVRLVSVLVLTSDSSLKGWLWAERIDRSVLEARAAVFEWISPPESTGFFQEDVNLDPSSASVYFGEKEAEKLYQQTKTLESRTALRKKIAVRLGVLIRFVREEDIARHDEIVAQALQNKDLGPILRKMDYPAKAEELQDKLSQLSPDEVRALHRYIDAELMIPGSDKAFKEDRVLSNAAQALSGSNPRGIFNKDNPLNLEVLKSQRDPLNKLVKERFSFGTVSYIYH